MEVYRKIKICQPANQTLQRPKIVLGGKMGSRLKHFDISRVAYSVRPVDEIASVKGRRRLRFR